jgi:hypothetical protein
MNFLENFAHTKTLCTFVTAKLYKNVNFCGNIKPQNSVKYQSFAEMNKPFF